MKLNIKVPTTPTPWPTEGLRRVSVNSFGASGTNTHAVLDDAYHYLDDRKLHGYHCTRIKSASPIGLLPTVRGVREEMLWTGSDSSISDQSASDGTFGFPRIMILSASDKPALHRLIDCHRQWMTRRVPAGGKFANLVDDLSYTLAE
jgi:acyl transferase domain-containing protein